MKKNDGNASLRFLRRHRKILLNMKFTIFINLICLTAFSATTLSQTTISLKMENAKVKDVLGSIENQSAYRFFYNDELSDVNRVVDLHVDDSDIDEVLAQLFNNTDIAYTILENNLIVVAPKRTIQQKVTGRITDGSTGEPLPGVNVTVEGSTIGTVTDMKGIYSIEIPQQDATLIYSFVGFLTEKIVFTGQTTIDVDLVPDLTELEEIVVIGYGTQRKGDITSSVASVKADDFIKGSVKDIGQLVQGKVAGLSISSVSGDPTSNTQIKLRGNTTILGASANPLVLIDGIPGDFNTVAPEDIESVDVLKDGSAAAIYGVRGTNGVIIITTKRAKGSSALVPPGTTLDFFCGRVFSNR